MYIITGYNGFIGKNFLQNTLINKKKILKLKRNLIKLKNIKNKEVTIINFAALYQKQSYSNDITKVIDANLIYPTKVLQTLIEQNNKIVFFNIASYFQLKENFKNKSNIYSVIKNSFINILKFFNKKNNLNYYNIYLYDVFGHGDKRDKIFNAIINCYKKKKVLKINNPNNLIAPVFIEDVSKIIDKYIHDKKRANEIHINNGKILSLQELSLIAKSVLTDLKVILLKNNSRDYLKIKKLRQYRAIKDLKNSLKDFFKIYV
jgi:nucleoside-diphosphate-sugar epimerase